MGNGQSGGAPKKHPTQKQTAAETQALEKLDPKIRQWLVDPQYTTYSLSTSIKKDSVKQPPKSFEPKHPPGVVVVVPTENSSESLEPEIGELNKLPGTTTILNKTNKRSSGEFQSMLREPILCIDDKEILTWCKLLQPRLNEASLIVASNQDLNNQKVLDVNHLCWKAVQHVSECGTMMNALEFQVSEVWDLQKGLLRQKQWLSEILLKTQDLLELLPSEERETLPFPLEVSPHLTRDFYIGINYLQQTQFYNRDAFTLEQIKVEHQQETVWVREILPFWDTMKQAKHVKALWRKGVPPRIRAYLWKHSIGNGLGLKREQYFEYIASDAAKEFNVNKDELSDQETPKKSGPAYQIQLDVVRTFTKLNLFNEPSKPGYADMVHVLGAMNHLHPERGYIQGMSYLAGMFLMYMDAADSFIYLSNLMENNFFKSFCSFNMDEIDVHMNTFYMLLKKHLPKLYEHFKLNQVEEGQYIMDWYITLFSRTLTIPISSIIWDCYFIEGETFIHFITLAILKYSQKRLLLFNFEECLDFLQKIPEDINIVELIPIIDAFLLNG